MSQTKDAIKELLRAIKADRDELRVQLQLGANEVKEELQSEWAVAERGWNKLRDELKNAGARLSESADDLGEELSGELSDFSDAAREASEKAITELRSTYQRLRSKIKN